MQAREFDQKPAAAYCSPQLLGAGPTEHAEALSTISSFCQRHTAAQHAAAAAEAARAARAAAAAPLTAAADASAAVKAKTAAATKRGAQVVADYMSQLFEASERERAAWAKQLRKAHAAAQEPGAHFSEETRFLADDDGGRALAFPVSVTLSLEGLD